MKTIKLIGHALNYAVIQANGKCDWSTKPSIIGVVRNHHYDTDWRLTGPIIQESKITIGPRPEGAIWPDLWLAMHPDDDAMWWGPTPLIAALRAYVASKLGDEIEIPDELKDIHAPST